MSGSESFIEKEHDFRTAVPNPYPSQIKRSISIELYPETIKFYRMVAEVRETGLSQVIEDVLEHGTYDLKY